LAVFEMEELALGPRLIYGKEGKLWYDKKISGLRWVIPLRQPQTMGNDSAG